MRLTKDGSSRSPCAARLEQPLGTRLVDRSIRKLQLTPESCASCERGARILANLDEAERCTSANAMPRGRRRVNANVRSGHHFLPPLTPGFGM